MKLQGFMRGFLHAYTLLSLKHKVFYPYCPPEEQLTQAWEAVGSNIRFALVKRQKQLVAEGKINEL